MCTVTIIPHRHGLRLACNRDESRMRPAGLPPRIVPMGERRALMPIDPVSGGTWIAVNDAGLVVTILNAYTKPMREGAAIPKRSRGTIIPSLLECKSLREAYTKSLDLNPGDFAGFRLVMADRQSIAEVHSSAQGCVRTAPSVRAGPVLFTSSGLGDGVVDPPRRTLFDEWFVAGADWLERQDAFHRHAWSDRPEVSVCMRRPDARTVSCTIVDLAENRAQMTYYPEAPDQCVNPISAALDLYPFAQEPEVQPTESAEQPRLRSGLTPE